MDDLELQSLKELSRSKVVESRMKGSLRKSSSLKLIKTQSSEKQIKKEQMQKIYNSDPVGFKKLANKNIFTSLQSMTKLKLGLTA